MARYDLILKAEPGRRAERIAFECPTDAEARGAAEEMVGERAAELSSEARLVHTWAGDQVQAWRAALSERLGRPLPAPDGAAVIATSPQGSVLYWDRNAARLYGWAPGEALGRDIVELTPSTQARIEAAAVMDALRAGRAWEGEMVLRHKAGARFRAWVLDIPVGEVGSGPGAIVGVSVPLAERAALSRCAADIEAELLRRFAG